MKWLSSWRLLILSLIVGFGVGSALFLPSSRQVDSLGETQGVLPTPTIPPTPTQVPTIPVEVLPTATPQPKRKPNRWVRSLRQAFVSGKLDQADELIERHAKDARLSRKVRRLVAEVKYARCQQAYQRKEWFLAAKACEAAVGHAAHAKAHRLLSNLAGRGWKLFLEGYVMENSNPQAALRRYREAASCSPLDSPYRKKALGKLKGAQITDLD